MDIYIYICMHIHIYIQYTIFYDIICQPSVLDDHEAVASQKIVCCMSQYSSMLQGRYLQQLDMN